MKNKQKVVIVFPQYDPQSRSHYPYWYRLFNKASKMINLFIVFESGKRYPVGDLSTYTQRFQIKPFNLLERAVILFYLRIKGYKNFYTHYSLWGFFLAKLVTLVSGGKTFLWDCEYYQTYPRNRLQVLGLKLSDVLVTGHEKIAKQYKKVLKLPRKKVRVVGNWVIGSFKFQVSSFKLRRKKTRIKNILFVHHLSERKGSRDLPTIIKGVLAKKQNVVFTIVGDGPDLTYLKRWKEGYKLGEQIKLKASLPQNRAWQEFKKADMFILPSRSEGFPRVILEAMKFGVPYVATDVGCVNEISPKIEKQFIVPPGDPERFSQQMIELLKLPVKQQKKISNELTKKAREFSLEKSVREFVSVFE